MIGRRMAKIIKRFSCHSDDSATLESSARARARGRQVSGRDLIARFFELLPALFGQLTRAFTA